MQVPNIGFLNLNYVGSMNPPDFSGVSGSPMNLSVSYSYTGPSRDVVDIVQAVSASGRIQSIDPPRANTSWELDFHGPALQCANVTAPARLEVLWNIANASGLNYDTEDQTCNPTGYVA